VDQLFHRRKKGITDAGLVVRVVADAKRVQIDVSACPPTTAAATARVLPLDRDEAMRTTGSLTVLLMDGE